MGGSSASDEEAAFRALHRRTFGFVHQRARAIVRNDAEAKDVAQEVYLEAWRAFATVRAHASPVGWLLAAATHRALDRVRHRTTVLRHAERTRAEGGAATHQGGAAEVELAELLETALRGESELLQRIIAHTLLDGTTQEETAALLDVSRKTVQRHLERFRAKCTALGMNERISDV